MEKGRISTNEPEGKKVDDNAQGLTSGRWHRLYVSVKEEGRVLPSIEDSVDGSIQGPKDYIKKSKERRITATRNSPDNIKINWTIINRKQKQEVEQQYGYFKWQIGEISLEKTGTWLRKRNFKRKTESLQISKVGDRSRGLPEGSLFNCYYTEIYSIPWIAPLYPWSLPYNAEC